MFYQKTTFKLLINSSSLLKFSNWVLFVENELITSKLFNNFYLTSGVAKSTFSFSLNCFTASFINSSKYFSWLGILAKISFESQPSIIFWLVGYLFYRKI